MKRFYSNPPIEVGHPYIMRNIKEKKHPKYEHEIVDIGIYDLKHGKYSKKRLNDWVRLKTDGWKVVPDCPDVIGEFGWDIDYDNMEYSWELLNKYYKPEDPHHLPVIQGKYHNLPTIKYYTKIFKREFGTPNKIAVGSLCKNNYFDVAIKTFQFIRKEFPDSWIHGFGVKFKQLRWVAKYIDSSDTTSWTFGEERMARNKAEKIEYFNRYLRRMKEVGIFE